MTVAFALTDELGRQESCLSGVGEVCAWCCCRQQTRQVLAGVAPPILEALLPWLSRR